MNTDRPNNGPSRRHVLAAAAVAGLAASGRVLADDAPVAMTRQGRVRGLHDGPVKVFKGIPYGAPTDGANRWMPALPPAPWSGVRDATDAPLMAPQNDLMPMAEEAAMLQHGTRSEDCLYLNVSTPAVGPRAGKRPVMVWFHGGGYGNGSPNTASFDGHNLVRKQDVVLVTISHRLNVFGFLYLGEILGPAFARSGNVGMTDCIAALRWVRENIAGFGGDPDCVTIFGQSGGGGKVTALMGMPAAHGLFHRAIAQSGVLLAATPKPAAAATARMVVSRLGVSTAEALQALPMQRLIDASSGIQTGPMIDGMDLPAGPFDPAAPALSRTIPFLGGTMATEANFFPATPLDPIEDADLHGRVAALTRASDADVDSLIAAFRRAYPTRDAVSLLQLMASQTGIEEREGKALDRKADQGGAPVYAYYFTRETPVRGGKLHAPHTLDIPYVMDTLARATSIAGPVTEANQHVADQLSGAWAQFARTGNPNHAGLPHWPAFDTHRRATLVVGDTLSVVNDPQQQTRLAIADLRTRTPAVNGPPPGGPPPGGPPPRPPAP